MLLLQTQFWVFFLSIVVFVSYLSCSDNMVMLLQTKRFFSIYAIKTKPDSQFDARDMMNNNNNIFLF